MHILYYITGHGYGHGVRSTVIANALPSNVDVTFRTSLPESFFMDEMRRDFSWYEGTFDCGCVQVDGVTVNVEQTLASYRRIADRNRTLIDREVEWCLKQRVTCILGDITPFAFDVADKARLPSIALSNFTWYDIYREYLADGDGFKPYLDEIAAQYNKADLFLSMFPANPMEYIKKKKNVSLIGRKGTLVREQIAKRYGFNEKKKIALIYIGCYGLNNVSWERLGRLSDWEFLSLYDVANRPSNFHVVNKKWFRYEDLMASADIVISKPGYGVVSECFLNGTPFFYIHRMNFAEYPVLKAAIDAWGGGYQISEKELSSCEWIDRLNSIIRREKPCPVETDGVEVCVKEILSI
ncbi:MAG: hypothetical protein JW915_18030 [Chitinispirillaceae bacterium]|nr:hypothetical protein [Chitinispirillaceae bacterium]